MYFTAFCFYFFWLLLSKELKTGTERLVDQVVFELWIIRIYNFKICMY